MLFILAVIASASFLIYRAINKIPEGLIVASGRIEGREVIVSPRVTGRIKQLLYDESDEVSQNLLIATIESDQLLAQLSREEKNLALYQSRLYQAESDYIYTKKEVQANIVAAQESLSASKAAYKRAKVIMDNWKREYKRYEKLVAEKLVSQSDFENVKTTYETSLENFNVADKEVKMAKANLEAALARNDIIEIKRTEMDVAKKTYDAQSSRVDELKADVSELKIYAPSNGVILTRPVENGEVVGVGSPMYVMVDMDKLYLKVYIPETQIGKLKLKMEAKVYVDAYPDRDFNAKITKIYEQAEFTPKNVETKEERVKLVFGVELSFINNKERLLKPGMPADAVIRYKEGVEWIRP